MQKGFTFVEVVIVIIILGILATLGVTQYGPARERALDKEAIANLKLVQAAMRIYGMESGAYFNSVSNTEINRDLKLLLAAGANRNWSYACWNTGCVQATRNVTGGGGRIWYLPMTREDPDTTPCP